VDTNLLCGLQGDTETQGRQSGSLLCSAFPNLAKEGIKASSLSSVLSQHRYNPHGH